MLLAASATALLVSAWLPCYDASDAGRRFSETGWRAFQGFDVYLATVAALAGILAVATRLARRRAGHWLGTAIALLALCGAGLGFYRLFTPADPASSGYIPLVGAYVTLGAFVAMAFSGFAVSEAGARDTDGRPS